LAGGKRVLKPIKALSVLFNKGIKVRADRKTKASQGSSSGGSSGGTSGGSPGNSNHPSHDENVDGAEMGLVEHVKELRKHLVRSIAYLLGFTILCIIFMEPLVRFLRRPFEEYQIEKGKSPELMSIGLFEVILMNFKICFLTGLILAVPFMIRELWLFVAPALYEKEKKLALPTLLASIGLFYAGISFGFFAIVPAFLSNTLEWAAPYANVQLTVDSYFSSLSMMVMIFGIIFEVPVLMSLLGLVGMLKADMLAKNRRLVILGSFIVGAVVSPPDVFSQVIVSLPLYGMIELSIVSLRIIEKRKQAEAAAEEVDSG
jgi:sec-independent protein translocase protein TatC